MRKELVIVAFGLLSAAAIAGWVRKPDAAAVVTPDQVVQPMESRAVAAAPPTARYVAPAREYAPAQPARRVVKKRSTGRSVAIVAGSAGTGAAVGALAGGKKGAGIGAISGGAAGFVYDQVTRNR
jgi:hypothetical protein